MIVGTAVPTRIVGTTAREMIVPTMIVGTVVPTKFVGTAVPTIIVLTAYYWKSCVKVGGRGLYLDYVAGTNSIFAGP